MLYKGELIHPPEELSYYILHKPMGYLSSAEDPHHRRTIYLLTKDIPERVFHVGRLDKDSEGLLLLTNDGKLGHRLLHPKYQVPKEYYVEVNGFLSDEAIEKLVSGVELEEGRTNPSEIDLIDRSEKTSQFNIVLHQGWKRQIRRMTESIGLEVTYLRRDTFGPLGLKGLPLGEWRKLSTIDINRLKREVNLP
ncbi:MAG TPA: rRNA pseudouridine synthase [Spirochaetes bacterium]|nr:rRNA pseudouridine synthase [Spirochaetota bacterium]